MEKIQMSDEEIRMKKAWENADPIETMDPRHFRRDRFGTIMDFCQYSVRGPGGWEVDDNEKYIRTVGYQLRCKPVMGDERLKDAKPKWYLPLVKNKKMG